MRALSLLGSFVLPSLSLSLPRPSRLLTSIHPQCLCNPGSSPHVGGHALSQHAIVQPMCVLHFSTSPPQMNSVWWVLVSIADPLTLGHSWWTAALYVLPRGIPSPWQRLPCPCPTCSYRHFIPLTPPNQPSQPSRYPHQYSHSNPAKFSGVPVSPFVYSWR